MGTDKYKGKYRISSARLASWDYGSNAAYFITICTHGRAHVFGKVVDGAVNLTPLGQAAWDCWYAIPEHFPFVLLDEFVAMPNHVHGIVIIDKPSPNIADTMNTVETQNFASLRRPVSDDQPKNKFGPQSQNLASIVRGFKIGVTKYARQHQIEFAWQARYHDHIVRNAAECQRIRTYIVENPQKWAADTFYSV
jgi:REP element-mobilizing transposase RayT